MRLPLILSLVSVVLVGACGDDSNDDDGTPTTSVEYAGVFGSAANAGRLAFGTEFANVRGAALRAPIDLTGTMDFINGTTVSLSGTLDGSALILTGGGYEFTGTAVGDVINGTFTGPDGETGSFSATLIPDGIAIVTMCGSFSGDDSGVFSLSLDPDRNGGVIVVPDDGGPGVTGVARPKSGTTDQVEVLPDALPSFVIATGTVSSGFNSIAGTWDDGQGSSGSFTGSVDACIPS
ncbi:MAG TPA: hypothetical protein VFY20_09720 [Gemmatimonadales bacterium]|nr:hypothetical protein [Gemmatimonadales bacterium]